MTMGERLAALRKGRGMTQEQLAERLSVSRQSVSKWELDQAMPEVGFAVALCELFGVSLDYLIRGIEQAESIVEESSPPPAPDIVEEGTLFAPVSIVVPTEPSRKPLTAKWYALFFCALLFLAWEVCLHFYAFQALAFKAYFEFPDLFAMLYAIVIPLPAVYLITNHWQYSDNRHALRHLWLLSVCVAVVGNLLFIGGYMYYCLHIDTDLNFMFWQTQWHSVGYRLLTGEMMTMAIYLPFAIRFHQKKWVCWLIYLLSWSVFVGNMLLLDELTGLLPGGLFGWYWCLPEIGVYFLMMGGVLASQIIVHRCLRGDTPTLEPVLRKPTRMWMLGGIAVICAIAVVSVMGGLYYALDLAGLPTVYLPMAYVVIPLLALVLTWGRRLGNARDVRRCSAILLVCFLPLMLLGHLGVCYFFQRFYACLGPMSALNWNGYLMVSVVSALVGGLITVPSMTALRKRPWACVAVSGGVILLTVAATLLLPRVLL